MLPLRPSVARAPPRPLNGNPLCPQSPRQFGFHDLQGFKDYLGWVKRCAPDDFPNEAWNSPSNQMTLDLAFEGLRRGLKIAASEGVSETVLAACRSLFDAALKYYREGNLHDGFKTMEAAQHVLHRVPSQ